MLSSFRFIALYCLTLTFSFIQAQPWSSPQNLSMTGQNATSPQIAIDSFGNTTAVWYRFDGQHLAIQSSTKPLDGNWQTLPTNLSLPGQDAFNPQIAIDPFGNAIVVWEQLNGSDLTIQAISKNFEGRWQHPIQLSLSGQKASAPQIAMDTLGNAIVVWESFNGNTSVIQASTKLFGGQWQTLPAVLSLPGWNARKAQIAIDAYETATVVWQASNGAHEVIQASTKQFQNNWQSTPDTISAPAVNNSHPRIAADTFGGVTIVWNQYQGSYGTIQAATRLFGENWQAPQTLSLPGNNSFSPQIAVDAWGDATVVWEGFDAQKIKCIHASTKTEGGRWQVIPDTLSLPGDHQVNSQIKIDSSGNAMVVWNNFKGFTRIHVSTKPQGGHWQSIPTLISTPERSAFLPQLAFNPEGKATVIWVMQDSLSFIQASSL